MNIKTAIFSLLLFLPFIAIAQSPFITKWTVYSGTENEIDFNAYGEYNFYWEKENNPSINGSGTATGLKTFQMPESGTYIIEITPVGANGFHRYKNLNLMGGHGSLVDILQWGDVVWSSFEQAFNSSETRVSATDIPNLSNVTNMMSAFTNANLSDGIPNINLWDVSNVTNMKWMFMGSYFNSNIENWDVSNVTDMSGMFNEFLAGCDFNQPLNNWDVSNVTSMSGMFGGCPFNQPLNDWDVSNVTNMLEMFSRSLFNQPLDSWDVSNVEIMGYMFQYSPFNQPLNNWDVSKVQDMSRMFSNSSFNQNIGMWNLASLGTINFLDDYVTADYMFDDSDMNCENYSSTLIGWAENPLISSEVNLGALNMKYSTTATDARNHLINNLDWNISGDLDNCGEMSVEDAQNENLILYPNPAQDQFTIRGLKSGEKVDILDTTGRLIQSKVIKSEMENFNIQTLSPGVYRVVITDKSGKKTLKNLIKK